MELPWATIRVGWQDRVTGNWKARYWRTRKTEVKESQIFVEHDPIKSLTLVSEVIEEIPDDIGHSDLMLAKRVLDGDEDGVWPLIDEIMMKRDVPIGFNDRKTLLQMIINLQNALSNETRGCLFCKSRTEIHIQSCRILSVQQEYHKRYGPVPTALLKNLEIENSEKT